MYKYSLLFYNRNIFATHIFQYILNDELAPLVH